MKTVQSTKPYRIIKNANIHTMDPQSPHSEAMAISREGRILALGTSEDIMAMAGRGVDVQDLRGRTVIPGFFDCHMHILWLGTNLCHVDLSSPPVGAIEDIINLLSERLRRTTEAACIQGNRYDQNKLEGRAHPDRFDLDRVSTTVPVRIVHTSGHAAVVNSAGLAALGIDRNTPDPVGGEIVRDAAGNATGLLLETASWANLERILPEPTREEAFEALRRANAYMLSRGITSATDANTAPGDIDIFREAVLRRTLQVRTNLMVGWAELCEQNDGAAVHPDDIQPVGCTWHNLHVGQAKLFADGAITTRTCWLTSPFLNMPDNTGMPIHPQEELTDLVAKAHNAGWQIATHAIGDKAVDAVLTAYAFAQAQHTRKKPGHRIEHCMLLDHDLISRLRRQNVWSIGQPEFLSSLGDAYITALGEDRAFRLSPYASLDARNVAQAFSSDCPVVPGAPLAGIRAAVERKTPGGIILNPSERISIESALYAYTTAPAYATRTERDRGSLEVGKFADMAVLSSDLMQDGFNDWEGAQVCATFVGGECLFGRDVLG